MVFVGLTVGFETEHAHARSNRGLNKLFSNRGLNKAVSNRGLNMLLFHRNTYLLHTAKRRGSFYARACAMIDPQDRRGDEPGPVCIGSAPRHVAVRPPEPGRNATHPPSAHSALPGAAVRRLGPVGGYGKSRGRARTNESCIEKTKKRAMVEFVFNIHCVWLQHSSRIKWFCLLFTATPRAFYGMEVGCIPFRSGEKKEESTWQ